MFEQSQFAEAPKPVASLPVRSPSPPRFQPNPLRFKPSLAAYSAPAEPVAVNTGPRSRRRDCPRAGRWNSGITTANNGWLLTSPLRLQFNP